MSWTDCKCLGRRVPSDYCTCPGDNTGPGLPLLEDRMTDDPASDDFWAALFPEEDLAELARVHDEISAEDPEAAIRRQNAEWAADPRLAWRQALSTACVLEGVHYSWDLEAERSAFHLPGATPIHCPDGYLDALLAQGSSPHAVACIMKATSIDPRFQGWANEDPDE